MNYTISDFCKTYQHSLKLLAGAGGMTRPVKSMGLLDYEIDPVLKDKYFHLNFHSDQLVITTFSIAKDNPFMILDAVKHLIFKGASGLVIKNVFCLPIHESVLRYANAENFPLLSIEADDLYVENLIYEVTKHLSDAEDMRRKSDYVGAVLHGELSREEVKRYARLINPSAKEQYYAIYAEINNFNIFKSPGSYMEKFLNSKYNLPDNILIPYNDGFFFIYSRESTSDPERAVREIFGDGAARCGLSSLHLTLGELDFCLGEALRAARAASSEKFFTRYDELGIFKIIAPFAESQDFQSYTSDILSPLRDYEIENSTPLYETLRNYLKYDCNITAAASALHQHKNTVRYRLGKIAELTGLDYKSFRDMEELAMAVRIREWCKAKAPFLP